MDLPEKGIPIEIGKGRIIQEGKDVAVLSFGTHLSDVRKAAENLEAKGISITIADARFSKPLDTDLLTKLVQNHTTLITIEEGSKGGFGAHVLHWLAEEGLLDGNLRVRTLTLADRFIDQASPEDMYLEAGLDYNTITSTILSLLGVIDIDTVKNKASAV